MTTTDLAETQALLGCGAGVSCFSGDPAAPTPLALAEQAGQTLQMEFLRNNQSTGEWPVTLSSAGRVWRFRGVYRGARRNRGPAENLDLQATPKL